MNKQSKKGAKRIEKVLKRYADTFGVCGFPDPAFSMPDIMVDVMVNLRHYCDMNGLDYYALSTQSYHCYLVEKQDGQ